MKFVMFLVLAALASPAFAGCPVINGHLANDAGTSDFSIHTRQKGSTFSYALGQEPLTYLPADGVEHRVSQGGQSGIVKVDCGADFLSFLEQGDGQGASTLRITVKSANQFRVDGTGEYEMATGNYALDRR